MPQPRRKSTFSKILKFKEPLIWFTALALLFIGYPYVQGDFSFCVFQHLGWENCWGCGIGKSLGCAMHGDLTESLEYHKLGLFILPLMISRIVLTTYRQLKFN